MSQARTVTANFGLVTHTLSFAKLGQGNGTVTSTPAGISCGAGCFTGSMSVTQGQQVTLTAVPDANSEFGGWSGACAGTTGTSCVLTVTAAASVQATFDPAQRRVTVMKTGTGSGLVQSIPVATISCDPTCTGTFQHGAFVQLLAGNVTGSHFVGWSGPCTGNQNTCAFTITADTTVTADFAVDQYPITVTRIGTGSGTVTSSPAGISCGPTCMANFNFLTDVTLTATPATGSSFAGWSGVCTSTQPTCTVSATQARSVTADFSLNSYDLQLGTTGNGSVTPSPVGTSCGINCHRYPHGTVVTVAAAAATGSSFGAWSGDCTGTGACSVTMTSAKTVGASFTINRYTVTLVRSGSGSGTIQSLPGGLDCGSTCSFQFTHGTALGLTQTPDDPGVDFDGWSGPCTGTGSCSFNVTAPVTVTASFTRNRHPLTITKPNDGHGTVTSSPAGVSCGATCTGYFPVGQVVTLTAAASTSPEPQNSTFTGWAGPCSGTGTCVVTMSSARTVPVNFKLKPNYVFVTSTKHDANFGGLAGADTYCQVAANAAFLPGTFKAYLGTAATSGSDRLAPATGWVLPNGRPVANLRTDLTARMFYPVRMTELGLDLTLPSIEYAFFGSPANDCGGFTNTSGQVSVSATDGIGLGFHAANRLDCSIAQRVYCFGVDRPASVSAPPPPPAVRYAFVTTAQWLPSGGLAGADARCQSDAAAASLPGTYKALLATTTTSAGSRFSIAGPPWVRVDGVPLTGSASALFTTSYLDSAPLLTATGAVMDSAIWLGVPVNGSLAATVGTAASTCGDWTNSAGTAEIGYDNRTRAAQFTNFGSPQPCTQPDIRLLCLQE